MSHPLSKRLIGTKSAATQASGPPAPHWPSYRGMSRFVGISPSGKVAVYVDPSLGAPGLQNANDLLADADRIVGVNDSIFGTIGGPVRVIVFAFDGATDGTGGADHLGCDFATGADIEVCAAFGDSTRVSALFEAELSECSMGGNLCGTSTGEALSRWCAAVVSNNALADFASAPAWFQKGRPDFVNHTDPTDRKSVSTGCGMAFLSWLMSKGFRLDRIAQTMVGLGDTGTLAQLYAQLTSEPAAKALPLFRAAVQSLPHGIVDDDPFGGAAHAQHLAGQESSAAELAERILAVVLADIAAGRTAEQLAADVRAIIDAIGGGHSMATCSNRSRRLRPPSAEAA